MQHKIVHGTGMMDDDYDIYGDGVYGDGVLSGGKRRSKSKSKSKGPASSYNIFVKRHAKKYDLSIPEAAADIKDRGLWKPTRKRKVKRSTSKRTSRKSTSKRRVKHRVSKSKAPKRRTRIHKGRRVRGRGLMGGANFDDLDREMEIYRKNKQNEIKQHKQDRSFDKIKCERLKNLYLNAPHDIDYDALERRKQRYLECTKPITDKRIRSPNAYRFTDQEKNFLLKKLLRLFDGDFSSISDFNINSNIKKNVNLIPEIWGEETPVLTV